MNKLKVCFAGIGSMAKRHIKNLWEICYEKGIELTIDALRRSISEILDERTRQYIQHIYGQGELLPEDYDIIFITNPTDFHIETLKKLHEKGTHFFIEKPLTSLRNVGDVFSVQCRNDSVYYVACPLRYTEVIQYLKKNISIEDVIAVRCICSSYLPDWRPGVDYRKTYSASKELGGGVSIDLIHEWDYIGYLFGSPDKIYYTAGKKSALELDCEDYAFYIADYADKVIELHLDYFGRKSIREIMLFTNEDTVIGDINNSRISFLHQGKEIIFQEKRDDYQKKELCHFLDMIEGKTICDNTINDAYHTLLWSQGEVK